MRPVQLDLHPVEKGWVRVEAPDQEFHVSRVVIAGLALDLEHFSGFGPATIEVEEGGWGVDGEYSPWLLIETPSWYTPPEEREDGDDS